MQLTKGRLTRRFDKGRTTPCRQGHCWVSSLVGPLPRHFCQRQPINRSNVPLRWGWERRTALGGLRMAVGGRPWWLLCI